MENFMFISVLFIEIAFSAFYAALKFILAK